MFGFFPIGTMLQEDDKDSCLQISLNGSSDVTRIELDRSESSLDHYKKNSLLLERLNQ